MKKAVLVFAYLLVTLCGSPLALADSYVTASIRGACFPDVALESEAESLYLSDSGKIDFNNELTTQEATAWAWGGRVPFVLASVNNNSIRNESTEWGYRCTAAASAYFLTAVVPKPNTNLDPWPVVVPVTLDHSLTAFCLASGGTASAYAKVELGGGGISYFHSKYASGSYEDQETVRGSESFLAPVGHQLSIYLDASASTRVPMWDSLGSCGAFASADPILVIDPEWEYAEYYEVWVDSVAIPEPSTLALLSMATLTLAVGWWRRKVA